MRSLFIWAYLIATSVASVVAVRFIFTESTGDTTPNRTEQRKKCRSIEICDRFETSKAIIISVNAEHPSHWMRMRDEWTARQLITMLVCACVCALKCFVQIGLALLMSTKWNEIDWSVDPITDEMETINSRWCHTSFFSPAQRTKNVISFIVVVSKLMNSITTPRHRWSFIRSSAFWSVALLSMGFPLHSTVSNDLRFYLNSIDKIKDQTQKILDVLLTIKCLPLWTYPNPSTKIGSSMFSSSIGKTIYFMHHLLQHFGFGSLFLAAYHI